MDCSPHAAAPSPEVKVEEEEEEEVVVEEDERSSPRALLPQRGLLPNTKHGLRRLVSGFGLLGSFATFLLLVSLLLLFLQQYPSPISSSASSSSSSASAVSSFLSWFLPRSWNVSIVPVRSPAPSPSPSPSLAPAPSPSRSTGAAPASGGTPSRNATLGNGYGRRPVSEGADKMKEKNDRSAGGNGTVHGFSEESVHRRTDANSSYAGGDRGGGAAVAASPSKGSAANGSSSAYGAKTPPQLIPTKCDLFDGRWVKGDREPYYPPGSCPFIDDDFNCHKNGRPDGGFLKWRWQPHGCSIPRLNATDFLSRLRGKKLIFVGDSLNRNMWESLVCILRNSIKNKNKVYEISRRKHFKTSGYYSFKFEDYQCSVDYVRSTFLVREIYQKKINGLEEEKLRLDILDETTLAYREADIIVFNTGHWWTHEKTSKGIDYYQEGDHVYPVLKVMEAFKKALTTWAKWVDININPNKTQVVFRGYSPTHFRGGQWNSGGQCHKESEPIMNTSYLASYPSKMRALEHTLNTMRTPVIYLNISRLTDYRKDGHPSIYRKIYNSAEERTAAEKSQDCSHWCLPGVPDTWNELLYASLLKIGQGTWKP